jgi:hypothetical protein
MRTRCDFSNIKYIHQQHKWYKHTDSSLSSVFEARSSTSSATKDTKHQNRDDLMIAKMIAKYKYTRHLFDDCRRVQTQSPSFDWAAASLVAGQVRGCSSWRFHDTSLLNCNDWHSRRRSGKQRLTNLRGTHRNGWKRSSKMWSLRIWE